MQYRSINLVLYIYTYPSTPCTFDYSFTCTLCGDPTGISRAEGLSILPICPDTQVVPIPDQIKKFREFASGRHVVCRWCCKTGNVLVCTIVIRTLCEASVQQVWGCLWLLWGSCDFNGIYGSCFENSGMSSTHKGIRLQQKILRISRYLELRAAICWSLVFLPVLAWSWDCILQCATLECQEKLECLQVLWLCLRPPWPLAVAWPQLNFQEPLRLVISWAWEFARVVQFSAVHQGSLYSSGRNSSITKCVDAGPVLSSSLSALQIAFFLLCVYMICACHLYLAALLPLRLETSRCSVFSHCLRLNISYISKRNYALNMQIGCL